MFDQHSLAFLAFHFLFAFFFRERLDSLEKEVRLKSLQRSPGHSHSHDSAIDSDLQEWETENLELDMVIISDNNDIIL